MAKLSPDYDRNVFINCPFDREYAPIFDAIVFAVHDCGLWPKCAQERLDSGQTRLHKIVDLIGASRYSIHDLSRVELDHATGLPRFNMPLELGIDLGCRSFSRAHRGKSLLIFDSEKYRFQKYASDLSGQDIQRHSNDPNTAIMKVRDWIRVETGNDNVRGGSAMRARYTAFRAELPEICDELKLDADALTFVDMSYMIAWWLERRA